MSSEHDRHHESAPVHRYAARTAWRGSTGAGYDAYDRTHEATTPPASNGTQHLSADPAFRGDPAHPNPEQLLLLAASSCQLLSFLTVAARARIDVVAYEDHAEATMPEHPRPARITQIALNPRITIKGDAPHDDRLRRLVDLAHRECFIANSVTSEFTIEPTFVRQPAQPAG